MRDHVVKSIQDAFTLLVEAPPPVPDHLLPASSAAPGLWPVAPHEPWFYKDGRNFETPQRDYFGFYLLTRSTRATLIGARYLQAGDALLDKGYCAAAVVANYTAALNLTLAYLALEGRVFIDIPHGPPRPNPGPLEPKWSELFGKDGQRQSLVAVLSRRGRWNFEARNRGHDSRWNELPKLLPELRREESPSSLPSPFWQLLDYCTSCSPNHFEGAENSEDFERDLLDVGVKAITTIRHEAVYRGYGYDDFAVGLAMEGESAGGGFDLKPREFKSFADVMVEETARDLEQCVLAVNPSHWVELLSWNSLAALLPDYELPVMPEDPSGNPWPQVDRLMMLFRLGSQSSGGVVGQADIAVPGSFFQHSVCRRT